MAPVSGVGHAEKRIRGINIQRTTRPALAVWRHRCSRSHLRLLFSPAFACPVGLSPGGQDVRVPFQTFLSLSVNQPANFVELRQCEVRRIHLPHTTVNRVKKKGRGECPTPQVYRLSDTSSPAQAPKRLRNHSTDAGDGL